jgi:hypothetical protein
MTTLKNREPPLVLAYSSPMKCKLTPEVRPAVTEGLSQGASVQPWADCLESGQV